ncbi:unnamed protein product [Strongylus vulgaris]|uniref:Uncharacterized protein n=1 Tax=Strongylus vulgaris TaxID=40348 RepID=A0A3P7KU74_STRVU|nr:unnamed protein product [Strongylus vulgaris]
MSTNTTPVKPAKAPPEEQMHLPVLPPPADVCNAEVGATCSFFPQFSRLCQIPVSPQLQYQQVHPLANNTPMMTNASDPTVSPVRNKGDLLRYELAKEKQILRVPEYSDYAWKRLEQEKLEQYAINKNYECEPDLHVDANTTLEMENNLVSKGHIFIVICCSIRADNIHGTKLNNYSTIRIKHSTIIRKFEYSKSEILNEWKIGIIENPNFRIVCSIFETFNFQLFENLYIRWAIEYSNIRTNHILTFKHDI